MSTKPSRCVRRHLARLSGVQSLRQVTAIALLLTMTACGGQSSSPTAPSAPAVVYEIEDVVPPTLIRDVKPSYSAQALAAGIQGTVLMSAVVLANGSVGDVVVTQSLDTQFGLDPLAVAAAKQWLFRPATKDGVPVAVRVTIEMYFIIR